MGPTVFGQQSPDATSPDATSPDATSPDAEAAERFEQHVRPLLVANCLKCHGAKKQEAGLRLDSRAAILRGGESGQAIVPGKSAESLLMEAVRYESFEMPPSGQLAEKDIRRLQLWIDAGAVWPDHDEPLRDEPGGIDSGDRDWWAFRPLIKPDVPRPQSPRLEPDEQERWSAGEIDRFVLARLAEKDLRPAPRADKQTLVRRLYFDLIGLPPSPEQVDRFVDDPAPDAWRRLVDRLLDDPRYGENWARYWLDLVRYSESDGWNQDAYRPHIWRYRDYVVRAFNDDKPYPRFVREQLAGDEMPGDDPERLAAAGFLRLGIYEYNQRDARSHWNDIMNEMTDVTGDVFLGLGMACARCHDHKFDPLLQTDYFKLRAFFEPVVWRDDIPAATDAERLEYRRRLNVWEEATAEIRDKVDALIKPYHDRKWESTVDKFPLDIQACFHKPEEQRTSWEHQMAYLVSRQFLEEGGGPLKDMSKEDKKAYEALEKELAAFDHLKPEPLPELMTATDFSGTVSPTVIPDDPEQVPVEPGFLTVLSDMPGLSDMSGFQASPDVGDSNCGEPDRSTGRRTALARWIGSPDNPLTTRVIVNRVWQRHFGRGIVPTSSDFGHRGLPPTHPELLDWLAVTFVEEGWSLKRLHRRILLSETWRQSAFHPDERRHKELDPNEELIWRARVRRLSAEQIRDTMLTIGGELDERVGGPSVDAKVPRRSLYVKRFRNTPDPFLHAFDTAGGLKSVSVRDTTTTPTQALLMINGDYVLERASELARDLIEQHEGDSENSSESIVVEAFRRVWGRRPTDNELSRALRFVVPDDAAGDAPNGSRVEPEKLTDFCHVLLNSNEFLYID